MKAIMMSIRPKYVAKILNGEKKREIRSKFPADYVGWVYIYCCKQRKNEIGCHINYEKVDGKVVARFWCDTVEEISYNYRSDFTSVYTDTLDTEDLEEQACLTRQEFAKYLKGDYGYAIHITKLEIFDKPKEISEFKKPTKYCNKDCSNCDFAWFNNKTQKWEFECSLTKAPQNYCYIESEASK